MACGQGLRSHPPRVECAAVEDFANTSTRSVGRAVSITYWYGSCDGARYTDDSKTPNLHYVETDRTSYTARDIAADEELTEDYEVFDAVFGEYAKELHP